MSAGFIVRILTMFLMILIAGRFMIAVDFVPTLNDIISIFKIASLEGPDRWVNGFFGPGYTLLYLLTGGSMALTAAIFLLLTAVSFWLMSGLFATVRFPAALSEEASGTGTVLSATGETPLAGSIPAIAAFLIHLVLFAVLKLNYSDGVFLFLLSIGLMLFLRCVMSDSRIGAAASAGLLAAGFSVLFRQHALPFLLIFLTAAVLSSAYQSRFADRAAASAADPGHSADHPSDGLPGRMIKTVRSAAPLFAYSWGLILIPLAGFLAITVIHPDIRPVSWQKFNVYQFLYGMDWYRVDLLLASAGYQEFSLLSVLADDPARPFRAAAAAVRPLWLPLVLVLAIPAGGWFLTRHWFHAAACITAIIYIPLILPGLERGLYPAMLAASLSFGFLICAFRKHPRMPAALAAIVLIAGGLSLLHLIREEVHLREQNRYMEQELEPALKQLGATDANRIMTDDYNIWFRNYNTLQVNNFQGWLNKHPAFRDFQPNTMFRQRDFDNNGIHYIVYLTDGYIAGEYPDVSCSEHITLKYHHICKL